MKWVTDTIAGRTILVLVFGFGVVLLASHTVFELAIERETHLQNTARLAERLVILKQALMRLPDDQRDDAAHSLSGGAIEIHWSLQPLATPGGTSAVSAEQLRSELLARAPNLGQHGLVVGTNDDAPDAHAHQKAGDHGHIVLVSMQLDDMSWINLSQVALTGSRFASPSYWLSVLVLALGTIAISALMARWLTGPVSTLTMAARKLFASVEQAPIPETGPREVRDLSVAFNEMRERINKLINDRTQTLAAISHDLRTPLTRLRLRIENLDNDIVKDGASADLDDMEEMIDATLAFLKGEGSDEPLQSFDLVAVLETITGDLADTGANATLAGDRNAVVRGRRLALKRAFTNILQNAVKYGGAARTTVRLRNGLASVVVDDDGPGIPETEQDRVFSPFYRIESSRSQDTGGHGLGLTVAQTIIRAHGGDVRLQNRSPTGLSVTASIPATAID